MMRKQGYLLFEICLVIALVCAGITCIVIGRQLFASFLVRADIYKIEMLIHYARLKSLMCSTDHALICDEENRCYFYDTEKINLAPDVIFGFFPDALGPPSSPTDFLISPITFINKTIHCYKEGTVSPGAIYLTDTHRTCMYALTVPISSHLYTRIYCYSKNKWVRL